MASTSSASSVRLLPTGDDGLDLVLGGGLATFSRSEGVGPATSVLVRGRPGAGKSALATQLAVSAARVLEGDLVYACVELLPQELRAQRERLAPKATSTARERVVLAPFNEELGPRESGEVRFFAGLLDLGVSGEEPAKLLGALGAILRVAREKGAVARVVVLDSVSEGYNLTRTITRPAVDEVVKWALSEGVVLVVVEESVSATPSWWSFACDVVLELSLSLDETGESGESSRRAQRQLLVRKNRFGPAAPGPHMVSMQPARGVSLTPHLDTYREEWVIDRLFSQAGQTARPPSPGPILEQVFKERHIGQRNLLVRSETPARAALWARRLWRRNAKENADVVALGFDRILDASIAKIFHIESHDALTSPAETVFRAITTIRALPDQRAKPVLFIALNRSWEQGLDTALGVLIRSLSAIARRASIPMILVGVGDTRGSHDFLDGIFTVGFGTPPNGAIDVQWNDLAKNETLAFIDS